MSPLLRAGPIALAAVLLAALAGCSPAGTPAPAASGAPASPAASGAPPASSAAPPASQAPAASDNAPASSAAPPESETPPVSAGPPIEFSFNPPGQLKPGSGQGVTDATVFVPGMRFPLQAPQGFANSQVWGHGGTSGPGGGQCDSANYAYPWSDDFCETRAYTTPLCPSGSGHQGQDIRPDTCKAATFTAVAAEDGVISQIGSYTVYLSANSGRTYLYLHMQMDKLKVKVGDHVARGQALGLVSNNFGSASTTIHLHFEIKQPVSLNGATIVTRVPPYSSLVDAYQRLLAGNP